MLNSSEILANVLGERLAEIYTRAFSSGEPRYAEIIGEAAKLVLERIGMSDALYHSGEHTSLVTLVGQDILRGERLRRRLSAEDWMHFTVGDAYPSPRIRSWHCRDDRPGALRDPTGPEERSHRRAEPPTPFSRHGTLSAQRSSCTSGSTITLSWTPRICGAIELTGFPVPEEGDYAETDSEAGLLRAADLIRAIGRSFLRARASSMRSSVNSRSRLQRASRL